MAKHVTLLTMPITSEIHSLRYGKYLRHGQTCDSVNTIPYHTSFILSVFLLLTETIFGILFFIEDWRIYAGKLFFILIWIYGLGTFIDNFCMQTYHFLWKVLSSLVFLKIFLVYAVYFRLFFELYLMYVLQNWSPRFLKCFVEIQQFILNLDVRNAKLIFLQALFHALSPFPNGPMLI